MAESVSGPLSGMRVLDLSGVGPGARCSRILADFGAEVLRVAPPTGSGGQRLSAPYYGYGASRGWRFIGMDLKSEAVIDIVHQLAARSDVVVEGFRPGVADRLGVGYEQLRRDNPALVYASVSGFGSDGPYALKPGHDINYVSLAGAIAFDEEGAPVVPPLTVADAAGGGMHAAVSILAALHQAVRTGEGSRLDVSMTDGTLYLMALPVDEYLATGRDDGPNTAILSGGYACYGFYRTADEEWLAVGAIESGFFANLCTVLECREWIPEQLKPESQDAIRAAFRHAFGTRTRDEWLRAFEGIDACVSAVNTVADLRTEPQFARRDAFVTARHPDHGVFSQVGPLLAGMPRDGGEVDAGDPARGDAWEVLDELGTPVGDREALLRGGLIS